MMQTLSQWRSTWFWLQVLVTAAASLYLLFAVDWSSLWTVIQGGLLVKLWPGPVLTFIGLALASLRWSQLLQLFRVNIKIGQAFLLYLTATFYGVVLPGVLGGDVVRVGLGARSTGEPLVKILSSALLERIFGFMAVLCIGLSGTLWLSILNENRLSQEFVLWLVPAIIFGLLAMATTLLIAGPLIQRLFGRIKVFLRFFQFLEQLFSLCKKISLRQAWNTLFVSGLFQLAEIWVYFIFSEALGISISFEYFLLIIPIVYLATALPISLGGLGVREGALVFLLASANVNANQAATLAILVYFNRLIVAVISGVIINANRWWHAYRT
ncbi:MAG: lysylphosphatidylglycerol synthase transmembrane domain-containing protein [Pusillimonas sp.]